MSGEFDDEVGAKGWDSSLMRRLLREARPHARLFRRCFAVLLALFALDLLGPRILRAAIDGPVARAVAERAAGANSDPAPHVHALLWWAAAYLGVTLLMFGLRYLEVALLNRTGQAVIHDLRTRLFRHIQSLDLSWFDRRPTGALVTRVTSDIENLNEMFTSGLVVFAFDLFKIVCLLGVLFWLDWRLALVVTLLTPLLIGISLVFRGGARSAHRAVRARLAELNGYLQEVLQGVRVVQVFRQEKRVSKRFATHLAGYLAANVRTVLLFALFFPLIDLVVTLIQGSIVWAGGDSIAQGALTYGVFLQFWFYLVMLLEPIRELGERYNILQSAFASAERVFDVLDTQPSQSGPAVAALATSGAARAKPMRGHVRFERVSFAYAVGPEVLSDVSFEIPPGQTVALVGATGAGKSTIVNLLLRFYSPTRGRITLDGIDLALWDERELRDSLGLVLQEDFLFSGTIEENLVLERPAVGRESLQAALRASSADELLARLPQGLATPVAERGVTLSTGERELLAMARALAGSPRLVILDEATSSVDSATEARIERATRTLLEGKSALVVAHRLSTVRRAQRILVMHKGRLREQGTHAELLKEGGIYARLFALQFREYDGQRSS